MNDPVSAQVIRDDIWIAATPARVFHALSDGGELARWWPAAAVGEPVPGGRLTLTWSSGGCLETRFAVCEPGIEVAYPFYSEHLRFHLSARDGGTALDIEHTCGADAALHIAQAWGFLKANLKVWIERGIDLRTP